MPLERTAVRTATLSVHVPLALGDLNLECRELDGETYARLVAAAGQGAKEDFDSIVELLERIIVSWDYLDEEGKPLPVTRETILSLPLSVIGRVARAILERAATREGE